MNHIPQKFPDGDCIVCCIAMALNVTYERVMQSVAPDVVPHGMWYGEVLHTIKKITGDDWAITQYTSPMQLSQYKFPSHACIYGVVRTEAADAYHYIVSDGEYLYDPLLPEKILLFDAKLDYHSGWQIVAKFDW